MNLIPRDNLFDFDNLLAGLPGLIHRNGEADDSFFAPRVDVHNKRNKYVIDTELPGVDKDQVKVAFENGVLTIDAEMKDETNEEEDGKIIRQERRFGHFSRSFYLGEDISDADIKASFKNGLLKLEIPKTQPEVPEKRLIEVD